MISLSQLANTNFLLLYFLIFLPPSTLSIIIFFYLASLPTLVSLVLHFLSSHLIFPIALSLFPFNLTSLLLLPSPLASLRVQSLVLFSSAYILRLSLTFFQTPLFRITFMLMILNSTSPSLLQIILLVFPSFLLRLILSWIGLLQIASLSIPLKLNFFLLALLNNVPSLPHPLYPFKELHFHLFHPVATLESSLTMISLSKDTYPPFVPPPSIIFANCAKSVLLLILVLLLSFPTLLFLPNLRVGKDNSRTKIKRRTDLAQLANMIEGGGTNGGYVSFEREIIVKE